MSNHPFTIALVDDQEASGAEGEWANRRPADHVKVIKNGEGKPIFRSGVARDITPSKQAELALRNSEQRLEAELKAAFLLRDLSTQLIGSVTVEELYDQMLDTAIAIMHSDCASIQVVEAKEVSAGFGILRLLAWRNFHAESARFWETVRLDSSSSSCAATLRLRERVIVPDVEQCKFMAGTADLEEYRRSGIRSVQSTPLISRTGQLLGMISTHWHQSCEPPASDLRMLDVLARQIADLIERKQMERDLLKAKEAAEAVLNLSLQEALRNLPVLVISQSEAQQRILHHLLSRWSMLPQESADAPNALARIHQAFASGQGFRLILADAVLPNVNGFDLANWLRKNPKLAGPVILMLSAKDRMHFSEECKDSELVILEKPISHSAVLKAITKSLGLSPSVGASAPAEPDSTCSPRPDRPLRVLLAEDSPANQKLIFHILSGRGHTITMAQNGRQALELLHQHPFDLVLMDVQMPEMDGFQATQAIRKSDDVSKRQIPIIALTAHALKGDKDKCLSAGMDAYLSKPIQAQELVRMVERLGGTFNTTSIQAISADLQKASKQHG